MLEFVAQAQRTRFRRNTRALASLVSRPGGVCSKGTSPRDSFATSARSFQTLFPGASAPQVASRWYGERPTLPDYLPMIGEMPGVRNVFVATGHQHLGLTLGPLTGELVAQLMSRVAPAVDLAPFRIDRF